MHDSDQETQRPVLWFHKTQQYSNRIQASHPKSDMILSHCTIYIQESVCTCRPRPLQQLQGLHVQPEPQQQPWPASPNSVAFSGTSPALLKKSMQVFVVSLWFGKHWFL
ncbi:hypothetical protein C2845_PM06G31730 [Panicum miliaceum]|uniref:Uncharacterized protein n=1 Tax=Panicum miliaceum TaxID=4540 RepID=A0A3L6RD01_PANMI|nr:hypothetical protein C2845_PM06G31730 [Panicum miliaceum]